MSSLSSSQNFTRELNLGRTWARGAGLLIKRRLGQHGKLSYKGPRKGKGSINIVTEVDRQSERYLISRIKKYFPNDSILSEESGLVRSKGMRQWVIDPLDGTTNFAHGFPMFCVSVALVVEAQPRVGIVYHPVLNEMFTAVRGRGAHLNGTRIHVTQESRLKSSLLATGFSYQLGSSLAKSIKLFQRFLQHSRAVRRAGAAALDLAYLACGRFDGFWERDLSPWDIAAGVLLVEEAGGRVSDFKGGSLRLEGNEVVASNSRIHHVMLRFLKRA
jgi:myo-inositol-1(or 4)-monophosphatase